MRRVLSAVCVVPFLFGVVFGAGALWAAEDDRPELFWGDTHVHSAYSLDANLFNNFTLGPEAAYRFARGETVVTGAGAEAKLARPLDFLVVSDHAEYMGVFKMIRDDHPAVAGSDTAKIVKRLIDENPVFGPEDINSLNQVLNGDPMAGDPTLQRLVWDDVIDIAERMNEPGRFTTIVGYEWGSTPNGNNLHRNVVFRDGPDRTKQVLPFSAVHSDRPEDLWAFLETYEAETGGQAFAIPHNSNLSNGLMFAVEDSEGAPFDAAYATRRARCEPQARAPVRHAWLRAAGLSFGQLPAGPRARVSGRGGKGALSVSEGRVSGQGEWRQALLKLRFSRESRTLSTRPPLPGTEQLGRELVSCAQASSCPA